MQNSASDAMSEWGVLIGMAALTDAVASADEDAFAGEAFVD